MWPWTGENDTDSAIMYASQSRLRSLPLDRQTPGRPGAMAIDLAEIFFASCLAYLFYEFTWGKKTGLSRLDGPPRESWFKGESARLASEGNTQRLFRDAFGYNLWLSQTYGTAAKMHTLHGVGCSVRSRFFRRPLIDKYYFTARSALPVRPPCAAACLRKGSACIRRQR